MKYFINIWSVQWVETKDSVTYQVVVEIHLSYKSAMNRVIELVGISPEEFYLLRGYKTTLASGITMSAYEI